MHWAAVIVLDALLVALAAALCLRAVRRRKRRRHAVGVANPTLHAAFASLLVLSIVVRTIEGALR